MVISSYGSTWFTHVHKKILFNMFTVIFELIYQMNAYEVLILSSAIVYYNVAFLRLSKRRGHFPAGRP